ncbi:TPA: hypothetical protein N0F65_011024 [Lagenidium giganteum]|uniref:Uncharacterized protein n=1 Tax=Lagenidium giganteum TaxID=4803 RepID=A0AAV2ZA87_9STRA|nr:TPA: hypothetical protein N0F65_011024 [Lagenidium giganteum]
MHLDVEQAQLDVVGLSEEDVRHKVDKYEVAAGNGPVNVVVVVPESVDTSRKEPSEKRQRTEAVDPRQLNELAALVQQLDGVKKLKVGTVLETPTTIFGASFDNGLYLRKEYWDLNDIIQKRLASNSSLRRILVVGSPGIGKSVFGVFLLLLFMMKKKDIAYHPLGDPLVHFTWSSTNGYEVSETPRAGRTYDGLFDGNESGGALSFSRFNHAVYMNPWTKAECQRFADAIHVEDQDEWIRRFNLVGGKPRFVFSSSQSFDHLVKRVKEAIPHNVSELKDQVRLFELKVFDDRMKHIIFHVYRDEIDPSESYLAYSSLAVEAIMNARYQVGSADESTVATAHPIKYQHLKDVHQHLTQRQEFQGYTHILLFIVPNEIYDGFAVQSYKDADGKTDRTARIDIDMTQYVGKIIRQ